MRKIYLMLAAAMTAASIYATPPVEQVFKLDTQRKLNRAGNDSRTEKIEKLRASLKAKVASSSSRADGSDEDTSWKTLGTGRYTDDIFGPLGVSVATWDVEIMESETTPGYIRVVNPYGNGNCPYFRNAFDGADFLFHAENPDMVYMEYTELKGIGISYEDENGDEQTTPAYLADLGGYYLDMFGGMFEAEDLVGMGIPFGTYKLGNIKFETGAMMLDFPEIGEYQETNLNGKFCVALPGAKDISFTFEVSGVCATGSEAVCAYVAGTDISAVKYSVLPGFKSGNTTLFEEVAQSGVTVSDDVFGCTLSPGANTIVAVALTEDGSIAEGYASVCYGEHPAEGWKSIGQAEYSEAILSDSYQNIEVDPYMVAIEESETIPGYYRLVNPYGAAYPNYADFLEGGYALTHQHNHYMVIDATNPDRVMIEANPIGYDFGDGEVQICSEAWYVIQQGLDPDNDEVVEAYGKLADGKITFPGGALLCIEPDYGFSRGNTQHNFYIQLPSSGVSNVSVENPSAKAEYFTLGGVRLDKVTAPGLYIRRTGDKVEKIAVK